MLRARFRNEEENQIINDGQVLNFIWRETSGQCQKLGFTRYLLNLKIRSKT